MLRLLQTSSKQITSSLISLLILDCMYGEIRIIWLFAVQGKSTHSFAALTLYKYVAMCSVCILSVLIMPVKLI